MKSPVLLAVIGMTLLMCVMWGVHFMVTTPSDALLSTPLYMRLTMSVMVLMKFVLGIGFVGYAVDQQ